MVGYDASFSSALYIIGFQVLFCELLPARSSGLLFLVYNLYLALVLSLFRGIKCQNCWLSLMSLVLNPQPDCLIADNPLVVHTL